jgi:hypothetical protein
MRATIKALKILDTAPKGIFPDGMSPKFFAERMWPDSPAWTRSYNVGKNGATKGRGIILSAGSFLHKLCKHGYIYGTTKTYFDFKGNRRACGMTTWRLDIFGKKILKWHESLGMLDNFNPEERKQARREGLIKSVVMLGGVEKSSRDISVQDRRDIAEAASKWTDKEMRKE